MDRGWLFRGRIGRLLRGPRCTKLRPRTFGTSCRRAPWRGFPSRDTDGKSGVNSDGLARHFFFFLFGSVKHRWSMKRQLRGAPTGPVVPETYDILLPAWRDLLLLRTHFSHREFVLDLWFIGPSSREGRAGSYVCVLFLYLIGTTYLSMRGCPTVSHRRAADKISVVFRSRSRSKKRGPLTKYPGHRSSSVIEFSRPARPASSGGNRGGECRSWRHSILGSGSPVRLGSVLRSPLTPIGLCAQSFQLIPSFCALILGI